jgi:hypothetical protein
MATHQTGFEFEYLGAFQAIIETTSGCDCSFDEKILDGNLMKHSV